MNYVIFFNSDGRNTYFGVQRNIAEYFEKFGYKRINEVGSLAECENAIQQLNEAIKDG